ncbi:MAG: dethiobiotin synthase [Bacteroidales bacterium]|jgi:dethiobiotin synthetase|nr:dethiobiotin synthase [Bacteroidales bacterium]
MAQAFFISGIDTDCGKTFITAHIARNLHNSGVRVITQKLVQTGCTEISEDIIEHRRIMQIPLQDVDTKGITCPYNFAFPASPHFSAALEHREIDTNRITKSTEILLQQYDIVLIETAGGLYVPLSETLFCCNYMAAHKHPLMFVTTSKLGSINHSISSLKNIKDLHIPLYAVVYNRLPNSDAAIAQNTEAFLRKYVQREFPDTIFITSEKILDGHSVIQH